MEHMYFYVGVAEWIALVGSMLGLMFWFDHKYDRLDKKFDDKIERLYQMYVEMMKELKDRK